MPKCNAVPNEHTKGHHGTMQGCAVQRSAVLGSAGQRMFNFDGALSILHSLILDSSILDSLILHSARMYRALPVHYVWTSGAGKRRLKTYRCG